MSISRPKVYSLPALLAVLLLSRPAWPSTPTEAAPPVDPAELTQLVVGNNVFAFDLFHQLRAQSQGNLFFSPMSISEALAMTFAGARNLTEQEMARTLHFDLGQDRLHPVFHALDRLIASRAESSNPYFTGDCFRLNLANSLWVERNYALLPDFTRILAEQYSSEAHQLNFRLAAEVARVTINQWVSDRTEGRIADLIPAEVITPLTRLVLVNAIYFNASWASEFEPSNTRDDSFHLLDGSEVTVPMMFQDGRYAHVSGDGYGAISMPYVGNQLSMIVVLPDEGRFPEIEAAMSADWLGAAVASMTYPLVNLMLPKFRIESQFELKDVLTALGMPSAFDGMLADFTGMAEIPSPDLNLYISAVIHKAFLSVFERGTEAAAATAVVMAEVGAVPMQPETPIPFRVDRPFIVVIRDDETGAILFLGRVLNPAL